MKCSRVVLSLTIAVFGGVVMALSSAEACPGSAAGTETEQYSMIPSDLCPTENYSAASETEASETEASETDVGQAEEADYYDRGDVAHDRDELAASVKDGSQEASSDADPDYRYEYPEESCTRYGEVGYDMEQSYTKDESRDASPEAGSESYDPYSEENYARYGEADSEAKYAGQYSSQDDAQGASPEAQSDYQDPYSEESYGNYGEVGSETEYAEQYYSKYGYQYASPEEKYGYAAPYADSNVDRADNEPMSQEWSDAEADEPYGDAGSGETDQSSAPDALATNEAEEAADEMPGEGTASEWEAQRDMERDVAPGDTSAESACQEHGMENLTTGEESDTAETYHPTEEEMLARTELPGTDDVATDENDEIGPYQMEEYHPRYGYRFGHRRSYYVTVTSEETNSSSQPPATAAAPTPAPQPEPAQSEPEPGSVADRYGYAEYMGEDYLSELEDSSRADADSEEQPQFEPENSDPMDPESGVPATPEKNASIDADSRDLAFSESDGESTPQDSDSSAPAETPDAMSDESVSSDYDYAEPYRYYGHDNWRESAERNEEAGDSDESLRIEESSSISEPQAQNETESGIELFAYRPAELLTSSDQDLLRTLSRLFEEPSGVRRAALNDYLETEGTDALDFAARFEDLTGIEFLGLADDLPGVAAFLASYRLLQQSELGVDEASDLLRRSLQRFAQPWIDGVNEITDIATDAQESTSEPVNADDAESDPSMGSVNNQQVLQALGALASHSLRELGELTNAIPARFSQVAWAVLAPQFGQDWSIGSLSGVLGEVQR